MTNTIITLECGHTLIFHRNIPLVGEICLCLKCRTYKEVMHAPAEWRIKCQTCRHSAPFGAAKALAEVGAAKHRRVKGHEAHVVAIYNGKKLVRTFGDRMPTLDDVFAGQDPEAPPC